MIRILSWRRRQSTISATFGNDSEPAKTLKHGPYSTVTVCDGDLLQSGRLVASRSFRDLAEAWCCQHAWQRHAPGLTVQVRKTECSSFEPSYEGFYVVEDGSERSGQPTEVTALMSEIAAEAAAQQARRAAEQRQAEEQRRARQAAWEARQPREVVIAEAGDDDALISHHPRFLKATQTFVEGQPRGPVTWHFGKFTGYEPEPVAPNHQLGTIEADIGAPDGVRQLRERRRLVEAEFETAHSLWVQAVYRNRAAEQLREAAKHWPTVAAAFTRIEQAWSDLDHPPHGWEVAVKQLLDAHDHATEVVSAWEDRHARRLATTGADLVRGENHDLAELRRTVAAELGIDGIETWHIGYVRDFTVRFPYVDLEDGAGQQLRALIDAQRGRLTTILDAAGRIPATTVLPSNRY